METLPLYSADVVKHLDASFGSYLPTPVTPEQKMWFALGQRSIVDLLKQAQENAEDNILES